MTVLGLRFRARALSSCGKRGPLFTAVHGPLTITASPTVENRLQTRRPSNRGSQAQPLRGMRDPPRPGLEPVSPALAGRPPTTAPPGKPHSSFFVSICMKYPFSSFTFSLCVSLDLKWVSCRQYVDGSCIFIHSATLCLLIRAFKLLTLKWYLLPFCSLFSWFFVVLHCSFFFSCSLSLWLDYFL